MARGLPLTWAQVAGGGEVGAVLPLAGDGAGSVLALERELGGDRGFGVVEVAPAVLPDLGALLPAVGLAGEQQLEGLGEAGLAGAVAADDEREAGAGGEVERGLRGRCRGSPRR